jgi:hypothetical protein
VITNLDGLSTSKIDRVFTGGASGRVSLLKKGLGRSEDLMILIDSVVSQRLLE